jgi:hypothetical protein
MAKGIFIGDRPIVKYLIKLTELIGYANFPQVLRP